MHKKLFIAVLALGLLLTYVPALALPDGDVFERPQNSYWSGSGQSKTGTPTHSLESSPAVTVNAGQNRTVPGTFCDGQYQGPYTYSIGGWYAGSEFYAGYQDPQDPTRFGAVCANSPSFDVTAINTVLRVNNSFPFTMVIQPLVLGVVSPSADPNCTQEPAPVAGGALCVGPAYAVTWAGDAAFLINLPFTVECCVSGPYYAAWYSATPGGGTVRIGSDGGFQSGQHAVDGQNFCSQWNEYGAGWLDMDQFWEANFGPGWDLTDLTWSEGYTPDDPATHCTPGTCTYEVHYTCSVTPGENTGPCVGNPGAGGTGFRYADGNDDWDAAFGMPSGQFGGRTKLGTGFAAVGLDTLKEVQFLLYDGFDPGPQDLLIEIWDGSGPLSCGKPTPGALLYSTTLLGDMTVYPAPLVIPVPDIVWGTLNGGAAQYVFATVEVLGSSATTTALAAGDPETALGCPSSTLGSWSVAYFPASTEYGGAAVWKSLAERAAAGSAYYEFYIDARICREVLPAIEADCSTGGPDEWPNYGGDNQQTASSDINVGDPNGVTLAWTAGFTAAVNFTNPTVSGDVVYQSSDDRLNAIDLNTGALINTIVGLPQNMPASGNRGNTTVAFTRNVVSGPDRDLVFVTSGSFQMVSAWEANLSAPVWSQNPGDLLALQRFNSSKVIDIGGTDVLLIATEPVSGSGRLFAIEAGTGNLFAPWGANNPVILNAACKHGPSISNDGSKIYAATAVGGTNNTGSIYQIDAATGTIDWNFVPGGASEGWPNGVAVEGDFLYGASRDNTGTGYRYKIDKSGVAPAVVWTTPQGVSLYGGPAIGRNFVYFPLDNPNFGILQVDKGIGTVARNFASSDDICGQSVFMVPNQIALSCDSYIFAGDRNGLWWLLNAYDGESIWNREFPATVMGSSLASSSLGDDYAVVSFQAGSNSGGGGVSAYKLNSGSRPRLIQCVHDVTIEVPFGSLAGNPHSEANALLNLGDLPLNVTSYAISDPAPDGLANTINARARAASIARTGLRFMNPEGYFDVTGNEKYLRMAGLIGNEGSDAEVWSGSRFKAAPTSTRSSSRMAASASMIRTSNVTIDGNPLPTAIAPAASASVDWLYDGTLLNRGIDLNIIELTNDDPDFDFDAVNNGSISVAEISVLYVGGCAADQTWITWNQDANANFAKVFNHGAYGDQGTGALTYGDDGSGDGNLFDGGVMLTGDSTATGSEMAIDYYDFHEYIVNPNPQGTCGFEKDSGLVLGAKRINGCPGDPSPITGMYVKAYFADSNVNVGGSDPLAAIGINVEKTDVGADDPLYGDFYISRLHLINRDAVAKTIRGGTYFDWDVNGSATNNVALVSDAFNGYAIWDPVTIRFAYGMLDVNQPSAYAGVDPTANPPSIIMSNQNDTTYGGAGGGQWGGGGPLWPNDYSYGWFLASGHYAGPRHSMGGNGVAGLAGDRGGFLLNEVNLAPNGSADVVQATFAFDVAGNSNDAFVEAGGASVAARAARWAGFARGDVNDDGFVDLADVVWLQCGNQIYPDNYCGDVDADGDNDAADIAQLLGWVSGNAGSQPVGAWRFPW